MFNRANKLAGTFGADVFVVVKHQNNFRMYRNVGIEWAQELDINHLVSDSSLRYAPIHVLTIGYRRND